MKTYMMETRLYSLYKLFLFFILFCQYIMNIYEVSGIYFITILIETGSLPFVLSLEYKSCK